LCAVAGFDMNLFLYTVDFASCVDTANLFSIDEQRLIDVALIPIIQNSLEAQLAEEKKI